MLKLCMELMRKLQESQPDLESRIRSDLMEEFLSAQNVSDELAFQKVLIPIALGIAIALPTVMLIGESLRTDTFPAQLNNYQQQLSRE